MAILAELISDDVLDTAYYWLCTRRRAYPADADVWSFRQRWPAEKDRLTAELASARFRFGLLTRVTLMHGEEVDLWSARDALVLKALALVLGEHLPISPRCTHVKGHGGVKAAVRQVWAGLAENRFVLRANVKSYYASIMCWLLVICSTTPAPPPPAAPRSARAPTTARGSRGCETSVRTESPVLSSGRDARRATPAHHRRRAGSAAGGR